MAMSTLQAASIEDLAKLAQGPGPGVQGARGKHLLRPVAGHVGRAKITYIGSWRDQATTESQNATPTTRAVQRRGGRSSPARSRPRRTGSSAEAPFLGTESPSFPPTDPAG